VTLLQNSSRDLQAQISAAEHPVGLSRRGVVVATLSLHAVGPLLLVMISIAEPYIGRSFGLAAAQEVWAAESLIVAQLTVTPLCGFLIARFGLTALLRLCVLGFMAAAAASLATGWLEPSWSLPTLYGTIFLQGAFAAPLTPATQALIVAAYPENERARGMAVWTGAQFFGFLAGSLLAGWLAQALSWRLIFLVGPLIAVAPLPFLRHRTNTSEATRVPTDWSGFLLLVVSMVMLNIVLQFGESFRWFASPVISIAAVATGITAAALLRHLTRVSHPIVSLVPLQNRWFATAASLGFGINIFTTGLFETLMLGEALRMPAEILGFRSALGGLTQIAGVLVAGYWGQRIYTFRLTLAAFATMLVGLYGYTLYAPGMDYALALWTRMICGFGVGLSASILATAAFDSLPHALNGQGASLLALASALGTTVGIAVLDGVLGAVTREGQGGLVNAYQLVFWVQLVGMATLLPMILFFRIRPAVEKYPLPLKW
jgi:DHA2 family multidrug resistance protein